MLEFEKFGIRIIPESKHGGGRYRTLFEVANINGKGSNLRTLKVCVPGWDPDRFFNISAKFVPKECRSSVYPKMYFLAQVNLGASRPKGLRPTSFELLPSKMEMLKNIIDLL